MSPQIAHCCHSSLGLGIWPVTFPVGASGSQASRRGRQRVRKGEGGEKKVEEKRERTRRQELVKVNSPGQGPSSRDLED